MIPLGNGWFLQRRFLSCRGISVQHEFKGTCKRTSIYLAGEDSVIAVGWLSRKRAIAVAERSWENKEKNSFYCAKKGAPHYAECIKPCGGCDAFPH